MKSYDLEALNWKIMRDELDLTGSFEIVSINKRLEKLAPDLANIDRAFGNSKVTSFADKLAFYKFFFRFLYSLVSGGVLYDFYMLFIFRKPFYFFKDKNTLVFHLSGSKSADQSISH